MQLTEKEVIYIRVDDDELLTKKELCKRILNCDVETADKYYINQANFPYLWRGKKKLFPKKAVEKWIKNNTHYTD